MTLLTAANLSFHTPSTGRVILHNTNIKVDKGDFIILLGANGSGKSTLLKLLSGQIHPSFGSIKVNDIDINSLSRTQKACDLVTLSQNAEERLFLDMTISENITLWESRFKKNLRQIGNEIHKRFHQYMDSKVSNLSGGERQVLLLYLALIHPPQILFLDEHTSALDYKASQDIMELTASIISNYHTTSIMVTHNIQDALIYGNRIIIMSEGQILYDHKKEESNRINIATIQQIMYPI